MSRMIELSQEEQLNYLAEEVDAIISTSGQSIREAILVAKHQVGEAIVRSPLYKKSAKGTGELIEQLSQRMSKSPSDLYFCVRFYSEFPHGIPEELMSAPVQKVKKLLAPKDDLPVVQTSKCHHCPIHCEEKT